MWITFKTTVATLVRKPQIMLWAVLFPIILSTVFSFMFQSFKNDGTVDPVPVAVVEDAAWKDSGFKAQVEALAQDDAAGSQDAAGTAQILKLRAVGSAAEAQELLNKGEVEGVYQVDDAGKPQLDVLASSAEDSSVHQVNVSILETVASSYLQGADLVTALAQKNPAAFADPAAVQRAFADSGTTSEVRSVSLTHAEPDETVRYYYALLGMATLFGATLCTWAVTQAQPTESALGARRAVAPVSRATQLAGVLLGAWAVSFACLLVAFFYMGAVVGIDFAGREALCVLGLAAASFFATGIGAIVGILPVKGEGTRSAINTALACGCSLFAGVYGRPTMVLADAVARAVPAEAWLNPSRLVSDLFYSLYYYDSLGPFVTRLAACAGFGIALLAVAGVLAGRQRYEHL